MTMREVLCNNPVVVAKIARQRPVPFDPDKRGDRLDAIRHRGVWLVSRYGLNHELATMQAAADWLARRGPHGAAVVASTIEAFCDSQLGSAYTLTCTDTCTPVIQSVAAAWSAAVLAVSDGHNGVVVEAGGLSAEAQAAWPELEAES